MQQKHLKRKEKIHKENKAGGTNHIDPGEAMNPDELDRDPDDSDNDDDLTQKRRSSSKSLSKKTLTVSGAREGSRQDEILESLDDAIALIKGYEYDPPI